MVYLFLALKTLRLFPRLRLNLDAILYMSLAGHLNPLQKLNLCSVQYDMPLTVRTIRIPYYF